ncbi:alkaline phosphatase family protein [Thermasporomyces composti]|uniref:Putative AlkP superfamily pyrophosphatase or phosphodiesterase n=1 Tax=Thermasporomyces composti TaxID=696763 RepID=A0A3D9V9E3_THECX|nr:nucleotide pyrophosphatase/phosphodiesterase family protein [Thermasporomyces composti]REF38137.1 putative AlkP superfamily pyrophosphatase or phosphodiesterase [Thermasporomyces composti]
MSSLPAAYAAAVSAGTVVPPRYGEASLTDVIPSVLAALGVEAMTNVLGLPSAHRYVVLLIDGLGWNLLHRYADEAPYLAALAADGRTVTASVPATTSTSLVTLGTGVPPGVHGVVGYTMAVPGTDQLLNTLRWDTTVEPLAWQPHTTAFERAEEAGVAVTTVSRKAFQGTGLTVAGLRGGDYVPADSAGQRIDRAVVASERGTRSLVYLYEGDLDWTAHRDGAHSAAWRHQLATIDAFVARLRKALPADAVLVITADHGMVDVPFDRRVDVDSDPALRRGVYLVGGDPRMRYLYTEAGATDEVVAAWRSRLGPDALVLTRGEAVDAGWFGPVEDRVLPRLGDVLIASLGDTAVECRNAFPTEPTLLGLHGSLTPDEMIVPLLIAV